MEKLRKSRMIALLTALTLALSIVFVPSAGAEQVKAEPAPVLAEQRVETPAADIPRPSAESEFIGVATVASYEDATGGDRGTAGGGVERQSLWQYNYTAESWATYETALKDGLSASAAASALVPLSTVPVTESFFAGWTTEAVNAVVTENSGRLCDSIGDGLNTNGVYNAGDFSRNTTFAAGDGWFSMTAAADFTGKAMGWKNMDRSAKLNPNKVNSNGGADYPFMSANVAGLSGAEGIRFKLEITGGSVERILIGLSNCNTMVREQYALKLKGAYVGADGYINIPFDCFEAAFWGSKFSQDELEDVIVFIIEAYGATEGTTVKVSDLRGYRRLTVEDVAADLWEYNYTPESWAALQAAVADGDPNAASRLELRGTRAVTGDFFAGWTTDAVNAVVSANGDRICDSIGNGLNLKEDGYNAGDFSRNTTFAAGDGWFSMTAAADFTGKSMGWKNMDRSATLNSGKVNAGADYPFMAGNVAGLSMAEGIRFKLEVTGSVERILIGLSNCNTMVREQYALKLKPANVGEDGYINIPFGCFEAAFWGTEFSQAELEDVIVFIIEAYGATEGTSVRVSDLRGYVTATGEPEIPDEPDPQTGFIYPRESEYVGSHYRATDSRVITFDEMFPEGFTGDTSWDPMGIDGNGIIYFGYTGRRTDLIAGETIEDFAVFSYDPEKDVVKFLGTFIEACKASNNYVYGEEIPKGHTKFYCIDNKMYMASQSFHDYKNEIDGSDGYLTKRGAHLFVYDIEKEILFDLSSKMPGGVWCEHQGVVAMNYMPELGKLVGFTHPLADLVFYDLATGTVDRYVNGIPWSLGNPLSREIIVSGDRVYLYRGVEDPGSRAELQWPVYCYDYGDDELFQTGDTMKGGFWNGQATTSDGRTTYISGCCGVLYKMDMETGRVTLLRDMDLDGENVIGYTYSISMSPDETKLFYIPTARAPGCVYEYDIATNTVALIADVPAAVYCGSNIVTEDDWYYFTCFGSGGSWSGNPRLVAYKLEAWE